jgi:hypothetical protein
MIVIGYQGIGKSTLAGRERRYIDLESGNFWVDGKRAEDWYKPYCQIAEHLSQQGYTVFVSSHEVVRKQPENTGETVVVVYPAINSRDYWVDKLHQRYMDSGLEKDWKALKNAEERFNENIRDLEESAFAYKLTIEKPDYDLEAMLVHFRNSYCR